MAAKNRIADDCVLSKRRAFHERASVVHILASLGQIESLTRCLL